MQVCFIEIAMFKLRYPLLGSATVQNILDILVSNFFFYALLQE